MSDDEGLRDAENAKQIAAVAKQMDDWAARFGGEIFGAVKMRYGELADDHVVKIGTPPTPELEREVMNPPIEYLLQSEAQIAPPQKVSWLTRILNFFKEIWHGKASRD